jgi:hypothetical protein
MSQQTRRSVQNAGKVIRDGLGGAIRPDPKRSPLPPNRLDEASHALRERIRIRGGYSASVLETLNYIELQRLKRELFTVSSLAKEVFSRPEERERLKVLLEHMEEALIRPSKDKLDQLRAELDILCSGV